MKFVGLINNNSSSSKELTEKVNNKKEVDTKKVKRQTRRSIKAES